MSHRRSPIAGSLSRSVALVALLTALVAAPAVAAPVISGLHFTGSTIPAGSGGQDPYWKVVAWPDGWDVGPKPTVAYDAWVFSGNPGGGQNVPNPWAPGSSSPDKGTNPVQYGGRWIGLKEDDARAVVTPTVIPPAYEEYSTIYATTFEASEAGTYDFSFLATGDNQVTLFVNGSIIDTNTNSPTISGGSVIGTVAGLGGLKWLQGSASVVANTNTLYAVVKDINNGGTFGFTGLIVVPEPSTYASACLGLATFGLLGLRRRIARRA